MRQLLRAECSVAVVVMLALLGAGVAHAADQAQWGARHSRNMVSQETNLPDSFDVEGGQNVKWSAALGRNAYGSPVISQGMVFAGANNRQPRDPRLTDDRAVLLCLNESDGSLRWQFTVPRTGGDNYLDWPMIGMCSPPTIEGRRAYLLTNRYEVVCLDIDGQANGNDGPFMDEGRYMASEGAEPLEVTATDADIVWVTHLPTAVDMYPHDGAHASILLDGPYLYLNSGNGVDNTHAVIRKPHAPSLIALDKETGAVIAQDGEQMGPRIFHATWSSPALGEAGGRSLLVFGGGDGVCYGFKPLDVAHPPTSLHTFERVWRFDCDPTAPKEHVSSYLKNRTEGPSIITSMPVLLDGRVYVTVGGDIWWGKRQSWLKCIDASQTGDITETGELWSYPMETHCVSTPAVHDGLVFIGDCDGVVHCVDAATGAGVWTHELVGDIWGSALVADGKVYIGSQRGYFSVLSASREFRELFTTKLPAVIASTPVAANGVLYINTLDRLYALEVGAKSGG